MRSADPCKKNLEATELKRKNWVKQEEMPDYMLR